MFKSIESLGYQSAVRLGTLKYSGSLSIEVAAIILRNDTYDPSPTQIRTNSIELLTNKLTIGRDAHVKAGKLFMFANDSLVVEEGAEV